MKISVVVPTYRRVRDLERCLNSIERQKYTPLEVIVVTRVEDCETLEYVKHWSSCTQKYIRRYCTVMEPGQVRALVEGTRVAQGDIIAFTDDDGAPQDDWLEKIIPYYDDPSVGGVGGRDIVVGHREVPLQNMVGKITWYGKLIGNHHIGFGDAREVDVLKGVNMSYRKNLISFAAFLKGTGAQTHNEVGLCLKIRRLGFKLIYDPAITVSHYPAARFDIDQRAQFNATSVKNSAFNIQMSLLIWLPWYKKLARILYSVLVGDRSNPGALRFVIGVFARETHVVKSFVPAQAGFLSSFACYRRLIFGNHTDFLVYGGSAITNVDNMPVEET